ncbi:MAG: hypothetical protein LHV68_09205 [Elusimicrobia bacterium]|nr:hypothetical protein [Candidatus Liberimonas magnetica]
MDKRKIFISHTKHDKEFLNSLDTVLARCELGSFRSELEQISNPAWKTLRDEMRKSTAMFLVIGNNFRTLQSQGTLSWKHTQNWIAYEIGMACQLELDVWVICENIPRLNFPVPYLNNYIYVNLSGLAFLGGKPTHSDAKINSFEYLKSVLDQYSKGYQFPINSKSINCPYKNCGATYNLHNNFHNSQSFICPQCLQSLSFKVRQPSLADMFYPQLKNK